MDSHKAKGITSHKKVLPPIQRKPYAPENKFLSKAEYVKKNDRHKAAVRASKDAYKKAMSGSSGIEVTNDMVDADKAVKVKEAELKALKSSLAIAVKAGQKDPKNETKEKKIASIGSSIEFIEKALVKLSKKAAKEKAGADKAQEKGKELKDADPPEEEAGDENPTAPDKDTEK